MKYLKIFSILFFVLILAATAAGIGLYKWVADDLPDYRTISDYNPPLVTKVLTRDGDVLGQFYREKRYLVSLDEIAPVAVKAFLASEDARFYEHEGVSMLGVARAAIQNFKAGEIVQGGSTITQQVIKSLLLTPERSYTRKLKEAILAYRLENHLTKDEILTIYMNQIFLGSRAYGVEAASREYFGKHAQELNLAEAALLAALPKAPSRLNPYRNPQGARHRQMYVLSRMLNLGWIDEEEYQEAVSEPLELQRMPDPSWQVGPYYLEEVRRRLIAMFGEDKVYEGGLVVQTPTSFKHLDAAQNALRRGLEDSAKRRGWRGPLDNIEPEMQQGFLMQQILDPEDLAKGQWTKVLVTDVQISGADVRLGDFQGRIDVSTMEWARTPDPSRAPEEVRAIRDATRILEPGDIVWASLQQKPQPQEKNGEEDTRTGIWELALEQKPEIQGAVYSMDPRTGDVLALAGGYNFHQSHFNRATQARRQPGSAFKPIVYSAALDNGYTSASIVLDAPFVYDDHQTLTSWRPSNFEGVFHGPTLIRDALVKSRNLVTIRVAQNLGVNELIDRSRSLGIQEEFPSDLTISLGSVPITLEDMCQAFSAFARDGSYVVPRLIISVSDSWGQLIYENNTQPVEAISHENAYIITNLLQEVVADGTGWRARVLGRPVAGKTGTTNQQKDAWYLGYSPYLLTGVYVGFDHPEPMGRFETGARAASPIWVDYRKQVEDDYPVQDFQRPPGIVTARIDAESGLLAPSGMDNTIFLPFKAGTEPTRKSARAATSREDSSGRSGSTEEDLLMQIY
ncbi:PBP1A family penicillin-binding protein [Desulfonatronospira sp.]|uniref:penicillin-binding protein 1A n=1 Tax=Desulfonatronospira sp. TaxID=1962951 RepID=UPI0025C6B849|nr:PBP1A family penicillin-binding protein [Desulfonatronospira sp.]